MNGQWKNFALWILILLVIAISLSLLRKAAVRVDNLSFSDFDRAVKERRIAEAKIKGQKVTGKYLNGNETYDYKVILPQDLENYSQILIQNGVSVHAEDGGSSPYLFAIFNLILPLLIIVGLYVLFMRQMQAGGNKALSFGKSRARLVTESKQKVTFRDVAGIEEVKDELMEIIEFLKSPQKFQRLGGKIPKGVLLMGPPGTGKTLLAKAIAGEANVPFFSISGSEFVELFVGVGASRVRDLFEQGKKNAPCIIFIDEIDAVGRNRGFGITGSHDEREQTLNQLLVEMDGFDSNEGVIIIAATNRPDVLDPALLRTGRFDRRIVVPRPDLKGREEIIMVHTRVTKLDDDVDLSILARGTPGFSGADLANMVNEAALLAARKGEKAVSMGDFEFAKDKVLMGSERRSLVLSEKDKKTTACHEAGHAVVAFSLKDADPLHKISIIPRGQTLGATQQLPIEDRYNYSKEYLEAEIAVMMGGRVAEELFIGSITSGAGNDLERATTMAKNMVTQWGMSEKMGPLSYQTEREEWMSLWEGSKARTLSEKTSESIDEEVKKIVMKGYEKAREILSSKKQEMEKFTEALLEYECLDKDDIDHIMKGEPLTKAPPSTVRKATEAPQTDKKGMAETLPDLKPAEG